jgi:hypothetical protein
MTGIIFAWELAVEWPQNQVMKMQSPCVGRIIRNCIKSVNGHSGVGLVLALMVLKNWHLGFMM